MNVIAGWIVGNTQSGPHSFRKKKPLGWQYSDGLVTQSYHESEVARLRAMAQEQGVKDGNEISCLRTEVEAYRKDAERWRYARRILPIIYIEDSHEKHVLWARVADESENAKADSAIDAAMGASA